MTHHTTTYNNSSNQSLPLAFANGRKAEARRGFLLFLLMVVMGVGRAWAQDPEPEPTTPSKWNGTVSSSLSTQDGTNTNAGKSSNPYLIQSAADLAYFGSQMNGKDWYVKLTVDIDLDNREWTYGKNSTTNFKGHFDGGGKTISNLSIVPTSAKNNGFFSSLQGTAASRAEVKNLIIDGVTISQSTDLANTTISGALAGNVTEYTDIANVTVKNVSVEFKNLTNANYVGGFVGRVEKNNSKITTCSVEKPTINITGEIKGGASYIGGAIGQFAGSANLVSTLDGLTVTSPSVTINKVSIKDCFIGAVFGRINTYSTVKSVTTSSPTVTYKNDGAPNVALNIGSFAGGIFGVAAQETAVTGTKVTGGATVTIGSSNNVQAVKAGLIGQSTTNVRLEDWTIENTEVKVNSNIASTVCQFGGFIGYIKSADKAPINVSNIDITGTSTVSVSGNVTIGSQLGGFVGYIESAANGDVKFSNTKITGNSSVTVAGTISASSHIGGFAGQIATGNQANHLLTIDGAGVSGTSTVSVGGNVTTASSYFGGFVGLIQGRSQADNILEIKNVTNGTSNVTITGTVKDKAGYVGGLAGYVTQGIKLDQWKIATAVNVTLNGDIAVASYIGGAIGDFAAASGYTSKITNLSVNSPSISVKNYSAGTSLTGGVFGRVSTFTEVDGVNLTSATLSFTNDLSVAQQIGTFAGTITGNGTQQITVKNVTIDKSNLTFGSSNTSNTVGLKAGLIGQLATNALLDTWTINGNSSITINGNIKTTASQIGNFVGNVTGDTNGPVTIKNVTFSGNVTTIITGAISIKDCKIGGAIGQMASAGKVNNPMEVNNFVIEGTTNVTIGGECTTAVYVGGFAAHYASNASQDNSAKLTDITLSTTNININGDVKAASYFGGLIGYTTTGCDFNNLAIDTPTLTFDKNIGAASYIGGAIGDFIGASGYTSSIKTLTVTAPSISVKNYSAGTSLTGGVFGRVSTFTEVDGVDLTNASLTFTNDLSVAQQIGTFAGTITGNATQQISVKNVTIDKSDLTFGSSATSKTNGLKAGIIGQVSTNVLLNTWEVTGNSTITVNGNLITGTSYIGGFVGYGATAANGPLSIQNISMKGNSSVSITGSVSDKAAYLGGFAGYATSTTNAPVEIKTISMTGDNAVSVSGDINVGSYIAGFAGQVRVTDKVSDAPITIDGITMSAKKTSVTVGGNIKGASYASGFIGNLLSVANATYTNDNVNVSNVTLGETDITIEGSVTAGSYIAGLTGFATTACKFDTWAISNPKVTIKGDVTAASYIGGAIGDCLGVTTDLTIINGLTVTSPEVSINKISVADCYIGSVFGRINTYNNVNNITSRNPVLTYNCTDNPNVALNLGTFAGGIVGVANYETPVTNVTIEGTAQLTISTKANEATTKVSAVKAGLVGVATTNVRLEHWTIGASNVQVNGNLVTAASYLGGLIAYAESKNLAQTKIKDITVKGSTAVNVTGDIGVASYVGGVVGDCVGAITNGIVDATVFDGMNISSPSVSVNNVSVKDSYIGSVFSRIQKYNEVNKITVSNPTLTYNNASNSNVSLCIGTFAGYIAGEAATKETPVTNVTINGTAQLTIGTEANNESTEAKNIKAGLIGQATTNVRLENWTIANSKVQVYGKLTTSGSQIGAFAGNLTGAANAPAIASAKITESSSLTVTGDVTVASYLGGFIGQATTNVRLEDCEASLPTVNLEGGLTTATSYVGGAIAYFVGGAGNTSFIDGLTVNDPQANINVVSYKDQYLGAVFGRIHNYSNVNNVTVSSPKLTYSASGNPNVALNLGTFAGYLSGVNLQETPVTNVNITGTAELTIGTETNKSTTTISAIKAGVIGTTTTNVRLENWTVANSIVQAYGSLTAAADYFGGLAGYMESGSSTPLTLKNVNITGNSSINVTGNIIKTSYLGGFAGYIVSSDAVTSYVNIDGAGIDGTSKVSVGGDVTTETSYGGGFAGYMQGRSKDGNYFKADNVSIGTTDLTISGQITKASYFGGIVGRATTSCAFSNWKIKTASKLTFNRNITDLSYIGGAIGSLEGAKGYPSTAISFDVKGLDINFDCDITTKGIYVGGIVGQMTAIDTTPNKIEKSSASGKIYTTGSHTYTNGNLPYIFGGILGYTEHNAGANVSEVNNCVSEVDFDLSGFSPATTGNMKSGLAVGGVIGRIQKPSRLPDALYYSGKIYAPFAAVAPIVGVFTTSGVDADAYIYDDYSGVKATAVASEWEAKEQNWYYNGYQLGLSQDLLNETDRSKNYSETTTEIDGIKYLTITDETLTDVNTIGGEDKHSKTILPYTAHNSNDDKGIYPKWTTNNTSYPAYYMYYMQGVNRGVFIEDDQVETIKEQILSGTLTILILTDANADLTIAANRGVISHALTATASDADSFKWYVDGIELTDTKTATCDVTPLGIGSVVRVEAIKDGKVIKSVERKINSVLKVRDVSAELYGTNNNPYLITNGAELQLLSYLTTLPLTTEWEKTYTSGNHYNKAYYELANNVNMSGIDNFVPISFSNTALNQELVFDGVFDGKMHTISGLKQEWYGGVLNINDSYNGWGLFSIVGSPTATVKVGDSQTSPAVIRNLIIDGAVLTHDTNNLTFNYNNNTAKTDASSSSCIGVLAGIVQNNTKIENVEIRNSEITDEGSSDYSLATRGLYVGGAVGSIQNAFNDIVNAPTNTNIQHIAAQVNLTLEHPQFADATKPEQLGVFNIGGIIGRYCATSALQAQAQVSMPSYTLYSGSVKAPKAWISPVLGALRYASQQGISFANYSKIWEGNNNAAGAQLNITNAQYYNFSINDELITELYPTNACSNNARSRSPHTDATEVANTYNAAKYQGVNYGTRFIDSNGTSLYFMNQNNTDGIYWVWDNGFPHMTDQKPNDAYLAQYSSDFTANMVEGSGDSYRWEISFDGKTWSPTGGTGERNTITSSGQPKLVVAIITVGDKEYRTQAELAFNVPYMPFIKQDGDDATGYVLSVNWKDLTPSGSVNATYQWYHSDKTTPFEGETNSSITLTKNQLDEETKGIVWCKVVLSELDQEIATFYLMNAVTVVYVNGNGYTGNSAGVGIDTNDGMSPQTPVKTIDKANSLLDGGPWDKNIIVVMGTLNSDGDFRSTGSNPATLTGKWDGVDYEGVIKLKQINANGDDENAVNLVNQPGKIGSNCYVKADTKFEYLTFQANDNGAGNNFIECHGNDVWFGKGLVMTNFCNLSKSHGNLLVAENIPELTIVLTATNLNEEDIRKYTNRTRPQTLTIESGRYGRIMGGRYTNGFFAKAENTSHTILGSPEHPIWAIVNVNIDKENPNKGTINRKEDPNKGTVTDNFTCDINCIIAGLTDGTMYGDYEINVHGGDIRYIVGGNQGNPVPNGTMRFNQPDGNLGNWGQWPNASYFGRTVINVEQDSNLKDITINNLYAGGLGREANGTSATSIVDMYMYGHTEINMKSGTVTGNVYGGGAGGVIGLNPWDMHVPYATTDAENATNAIMNGVQYGEWGPKKAGSPLANVTLHDSDDNGGYTTKLLNLGESYTTLNISGGTINGSVYGGGCGYVSNMPKEVVMQGVGSVFGTSNVNISGGTIHGSVYGGSEGSNKYYDAVNKYFQTINHIAEMNGTVNMTITCDDPQQNPLTIDGSIYGAGKGIETVGAEEYLRIATAGNADLGDEYKTDINITIDMPESIEFPNDIYGGGALGKVDGNTNIVLKRGKFTGSIYGGGFGELQHLGKAMVTGTTNIYTGAVNVADVNRGLPVSILPIDTKIPTIYGGGNMAQVTGNTYINLWHGNITADVFGGGKGLTQSLSGSFTDYGKVTGNTRVLYNNTTKDNKLTGNIYGGGALGAVVGTGTGQDKGTTVVIKAGEVDGDVFGGGKGEEGSEKAKVIGNTNVIVDSGWEETPEPTPEPEP